MISRQRNPVLKAIRSYRPLRIVGPDDEDSVSAVIQDLEGLTARLKATQKARKPREPLLTVKEGARVLGNSPSYIYANQHKLAYVVKVGTRVMVDPRKLDAAIEAGEA